MIHKSPWWKTTTIYQIYPRSYKDSTGNGIGDIPGIISELDYIKNLGFETIWFSPFFSSPQEDFGYDIAGYREIAPEYGTLENAEQLISEIHQRGMKVILDLVLNHTSIKHPWFIESCSSRENPKSDWYIWKDGKGKNRPPNNWKALPGGSGWHYHPDRDQWYYASFLPFQPDLNFRNPEVKEEMINTALFWLEKGVDGFRLDIFHAIYKGEHFQDNPFHWSFVPGEEKYGFFTEWKYTVNQPETIELAHEMRGLMDKHSPEHFMLGEIFGDELTIKKYLGDGTDGMHAMFLWDLIDFEFKADFLWDTLDHFESCYPPPYSPVLVFGNHDKRRWIDRLGGDRNKAKLITLLQLTARGIPVVYYGEEVGLPEGNNPANNALDPMGRRYSWAPNWLVKAFNVYVNRDNCRTPMVWKDEPQGGFTKNDVNPWLPLSSDPGAANVAEQISDEDSLLNWYKALLKLRKSSPVLQNGSLSLLAKNKAKRGLLGYGRELGNDKLTILMNFSPSPIEIDIEASKILIQTGQVTQYKKKFSIGGYAGVIAK